MINKILIFSFVCLAFSTVTHASGLSVSPARLEVKMDSANKAETKLVVANPTADVLVFEVYPDEFSEIISVTPQSFTLEAGDRKEVSITVDLKKASTAGGKVFSTNISVVGKALAESKINILTGAKIPVTITASPSVTAQPFYSKYSLIILAALMIGLLLARKKLAQ